MEPYNETEQEKYQRARKRVEELRGFYGNLTAYLVVNLFLAILNLATAPEHIWFIWPLMGWGLGVLFHGMKVFNYSPFFNKDWEARKMREFMEAEDRKRKQFEP